MSFQVPPPSSCAIILSYQCSSRCRHCINASSPSWVEWASRRDIDRQFEALAAHSQYLSHLYISGGEPMLKPALTAYAVHRALELDLPLEYVETNAFWCWDEERALEGFIRLKEAGLKKVAISISPFHAEFVPLPHTEIAMDAAQEVFGTNNVILNTAEYFQELFAMEVEDTLELEHYIENKGAEEAALSFASEYELIPNGRAAVALADLFNRQPASAYFGEACEKELSNPYQVRMDHEGNYIPGLCAGIVLGSTHDLSALFAKRDWSDRPLINTLAKGGVEALLAWAKSHYDYQEDVMGYTSKCHLCLDIRRHLVRSGVVLKELKPLPFYDELDPESFIDIH